MDLDTVSAADLVQALFKAATGKKDGEAVAQVAPAPTPAPVAAPVAFVVADADKKALCFEKAARFITLDKTFKQLAKEKEALGKDLYDLIPQVAQDRATITLSDGSSVAIGQKTEKRATKTGLMEFFTAQNLKEKAEEYWKGIKGKLKKCLSVTHAGEAAPADEDED